MLPEKFKKLKMIYAPAALIFIFFAMPVYAVENLTIDKNEPHIFLGNRCETLEDKSGNINVFTIISGDLDSDFKKVKNMIPNYGVTKSVYWVRFTLTSNVRSEFTELLEIGFPLLDNVQLFLFSDKDGHILLTQHETTGRDFSFKDRKIENRNFVFPFRMHPDEKLIFLLRIETDDGMIFPISLWNPDHFTRKVQLEHFLFGIYYGIILVMIFYNFFIYISTSDRNYLIYVLFITFFGLFQLAMNGLAIQYLWPETPWWGIRANPFLIGMSSFFGSYFSIKFLNMETNVPVFNRILQFLMAMGAILVVASLFVDYSITILAGQIIPLVMILAGISAAVVCLKRGIKTARFYLIASSAFFIGVILSTLRIIGLLPHTFITEYGLQIGSGLEMVLLSFALADKINMMKKEKDKAQLELINSQQIIVTNLNKSKMELEEAHRHLSVSEEKYRLLVEGSSDIIFTLDENLEFISANYAIANELRLNPETIQGLSFIELLYRDERDDGVSIMIVKQKLEELQREKKPVVFRAFFVSPINSEPKEMQVRLEYINMAGKNEILGKITSVIDDSLLKYLSSEIQKYSIGNHLVTANEITHRITRNLTKYLDPGNIKVIQIALREIIINAIEHGNLGLTFDEKSASMVNDNYFNLIRERQLISDNQDKKVHIDYSINDDCVIYTVADEGEGFNKEKYTSAFQEEINEQLLFHGRGISIARNAFDSITYNDKGNLVTLVKYLKKTDGEQAG